MIPFGSTGKKVELYKFQPIIIITILDAWCLLWAYAHRPSRRTTMKLQEQIDYIMESLKRLAESLMIIQPNSKMRPTTVNVTLSPYQMLSKRKGKVIRFMFGASIR